MLTRSLPHPLPRWRLAPSVSLWVALFLTFTTNEACAAALGSLATSVGLLAALAALLVMKSWPAHLPSAALSTGGGLIVVAAGIAWLWRGRVTQRIAAFVPSGYVERRTRGGRPVHIANERAAISLPIGFQHAALITDLRAKFVQLQAAWDLDDLPALTLLTTSEMLYELCADLPGCAVGSESNRTDVITLDAELLGFEELAGVFLVSVEFSGLIREEADRGAVPFREVWMLAKTKQDGADWKLARHQALL